MTSDYIKEKYNITLSLKTTKKIKEVVDVYIVCTLNNPQFSCVGNDLLVSMICDKDYYKINAVDVLSDSDYIDNILKYENDIQN